MDAISLISMLDILILYDLSIIPWMDWLWFVLCADNDHDDKKKLGNQHDDTEK